MSIALPPTLEENDLIGCGIVGLLEAWERYDSSRGVEFPSYAFRRIKGAMEDELRKIAWGPRSFFSRLRKLHQAEENLEQRLKRVPHAEEIATELNWTVQEVEEIWRQHHIYAVTSLDSMLFGNMEEEGLQIEEALASEEDLEETYQQKVQQKELAAALEEISERERIILSLYYYEKLTQKEIAEVMSISTVRVSQLHSRALQKLHQYLKKENQDSV